MNKEVRMGPLKMKNRRVVWI